MRIVLQNQTDNGSDRFIVELNVEVLPRVGDLITLPSWSTPWTVVQIKHVFERLGKDMVQLIEVYISPVIERAFMFQLDWEPPFRPNPPFSLPEFLEIDHLPRIGDMFAIGYHTVKETADLDAIPNAQDIEHHQVGYVEVSSVIFFLDMPEGYAAGFAEADDGSTCIIVRPLTGNIDTDIVRRIPLYRSFKGGQNR